MQEERKKAQKKGKRRSPTLLSMQWLAERVRRLEGIKRAISEKKYQVSSKDVAESLVDPVKELEARN